MRNIFNLAINKQHESVTSCRRRRSRARRIARAVAFGVVAAEMSIGAANRSFAATRTWDGGAATNELTTAANWSDDLAPTAAAGDTAEWNGLVAGDLALNYGTNAFAGGAGNPGISLNLTALQTGSLSIDSDANTAAWRMNNIAIAAGAGAFTLGNGTGTFNITWGGGAGTRTFTNNSSNLATFGSDLVMGGGGAGIQTFVFTGSGNWQVNGNLNSTNQAANNVTKSGAGTLTIGGTTTQGGFTSVAAGTLAVTGTINTNGGGDVSIGQGNGGTGTLEVSSTGTVSGDEVWFAEGAAVANTATGTGNVAAGGTINSRRWMVVGRSGTAASSGTLNVNGGTLNVRTGSTTQGNLEVGVFDAASGTVNVNTGSNVNIWNNGNILLGAGNTTGSGTVNHNAGNVTFYSNAGTTVGGTGVLTLGAGTTAGTYTYNLNGGTLTVPRINKTTTNAAAQGILNFNGGTLKSTASTATFLEGITRANVRNGGALVDTNGANVTIAQALLHSDVGGDNAIDGGLTKSGAGSLALTAANTYTGATSITGGALVLSGSGDINTSSGITVNGSGAKFVQASGSPVAPAVTLTSGTVDGTGTINTLTVANAAGNVVANGNGATGALTVGSLTFQGAATLSLTTAAASPAVLSTTTLATNAAGQVVVNAANSNGVWLPGTYDLVGYGGTIGGAGFAAFTKGTIAGLSVRQSATLTNPGGLISLVVAGDNPKWTGLDSSDWKVGATGVNGNWQLITSGTKTDYIEGDIVLFDGSAANFNVNVSPAGGVTPTSATFAAGDYTVTASAGSAGINGAATVIKSGSGRVALGSANSYTGGTTLSGGTLAINHAQAIGSGALTITGGALDNTSGAPVAVTTANAQNWNGDFAYAGTGDLDLGTGNVTLSGTRTVTVQGGTLAVGGAIGGAGFGITKLGGGQLAFSGNNTYNGSTVVREGTLAVTDGTTGTIATDVQISPEAGDTGTLLVTGGTVNANRVIIAGNSPNTGAPGDGTITQTGGVINSQQWFTVGSGVGGATSATFPVGIYNNSGGQLNIISQAMEVANFVATTGTVNLSGTGEIRMLNNTSIRLGANNNSFTGTFNQDGGSVTFYSDGGTTVGGTGILRIGHSGSLAEAQTYNLNGGTLTVPLIQGNTANAAQRVFNFNGGTLMAAAATTNWISGLTAANVQAGGAIIDSNGVNVTIAQPLLGAGGGLTKQGAGTLALTAVNTYGGATTVTGGTLQTSGAGDINASSGVTVNGAGAKFLHTGTVAVSTPVTVTNGTLDGTGTVNTVIVGANGVVANGNGTTGAFTVGNLTFNGGSLGLNTASTAPVLITNSLAAGGSVLVNASNASWTNGQTYNLVSYTDPSIGGSGFSAFTLGTITGLGPRQGATLSNPSGFLALTIAGDVPVWTGAVNGDWKLTDTPPVIDGDENWKLATTNTATDFLVGDQVLFDDTAAGTTDVVITDANVSTSGVTFNNSTKNYTVASPGNFGITGTGSLTKNGTGSLTISTPNTYAGGTTLNAGTLNVNHATALGTGAITVTGGTLDNTSGGAAALTTNNALNWNGDFTFAGTADLDMGTGAVTLGGGGTARTVTVNAGTLTVGEIKSTAHGLTKQGAGTLILTSTGVQPAGTNIGGVLNVAAGTLQFNRTDATGGDANHGDLVATGLTGSGTVQNGAAQARWLFLDVTGNHTFSGSLANGGGGGLGFVKRAAGTQTLAGTSSYTDPTTVEAGTLVISGANTGPGTNATVNAGNLVLANTSALGAVSLVRLAGNVVTTLTYATNTPGNVYDVTFGTGTVATIVSDRATPGAGVNHALSTQTNTNGVGGGTINFISGANVTSGTAGFTYNQFNLGSGFTGAVTTLNPTSTVITIGSVKKANNNTAQTLELGGTTTGNAVTGVIENGTTGAVVSLAKSNASTWTLQGANTYTGTTTVSGGTLNVGNNLTTSASVTVSDGTLVMAAGGGSNRVLKTPTLSITGNGRIDLRDNKLITDTPAGTFDGTAYSGVQGDVARAYNFGAWDMPGLMTSEETAGQNAGPLSGTTTIGVATAEQVLFIAPTETTVVFGQTVTGATTIAMYTYAGDVNFDGLVDGADYGTLDNWIQFPGTSGYANGDVNYDGVIDGADYGVLDNSIQLQGEPFPGVFSSFTPAAAALDGGASLSGVTAVPEPASLAVLGVAAASLLGRRRRRHGCRC